MRRAPVVLLSIITVTLIFLGLVGFGCVEQKAFPSSQKERVLDLQASDLDHDGTPDYTSYLFAPIINAATGMRIQRMVTVTAETTGEYTNVDPGLTDTDLLTADQDLEEFSKTRAQADTECSRAIGLSNVICTDTTTCSKLCSTASSKCKKIAGSYEDVLGGAIISYVQDMNDLKQDLTDARRLVLGLRTGTDEERATYLAKIRRMITTVARINANPLYTSSELGLCAHSDFGVQHLIDAANEIGTYSDQPTSYHYQILFSVKPAQTAQTNANANINGNGTSTAGSGGESGFVVNGIGLTDRIPQSVLKPSDQLTSVQAVSSKAVGAYTAVTWVSDRQMPDGYLLYYGFDSEVAPDTVIPAMLQPELSVKMINLGVLIPTNKVFLSLYGLVNNYYMALGIAVGLTFVVLLIIYSMVILFLSVVAESLAGRPFTSAFKRAFGRTSVRWTVDIVLAVIAIAAGYYVSSVIATQPIAVPALTDSLAFLLGNGTGMLAVGLTFIGIVLVYLSIENFIKIIILERTYGMALRQEKDAFAAKGTTLKEKLKELEQMIETARQDELDVNREYEFFISVPQEKVDELAKTPGPRSKALIDEYLGRVESAITTLTDRKKTADAEWPKWRDSIRKQLEEQHDVYLAALVSIPVAFRGWALGRYIRENGSEGITLDRDSIHKKKATIEQVAHEMVNAGLLKGAMVIKQDKVSVADFADARDVTVKTVLALKLRSYIRSIGKNLVEKEPEGMVAAGSTVAIVYMRQPTAEYFLFAARDKIGEAVEQWKTKVRAAE